MWKNGLATWEEYRNIARICRVVTRKAQVLLEVLPSKDVKDKKGFMHISRKRSAWQNVPLNKAEALVTEDKEKVELP